MADREYTKNKLGIEDLVITETATQDRGGTEVTLNGVIAANIPYNDTDSIKEYIIALELRIVELEGA